ncbi:nitrite reductase (NADH) small subunit [Paenibacillus algorifonticola]|uniref:Nitrite reductase (NADH) small subunit n=1 Tax=Paenibacillus algorifonticola TaxID=684063 RepID=A0A1I2HDD0_9BACL|nr:nitrite reductase small subunit NirD [Paenibacillus algorifonticola]SFF27599.1 nitrite reductase (NADH) small subunit [Paenibacillus algorifonticola]
MTTQVNKDLTYIKIGTLEDFRERMGRVIRLNQKEIAVFRTTDGTLYALDNRSPHRRGGPLAEGMVSGHFVLDPLYDWKIALDTGQVQAPDSGLVQTYPLQVEGTDVQLGLTLEQAGQLGLER